MEPHIFAPYLRSNWHALSVKGDLRSQYTPWNSPPSGNPGYSYLKCETMSGTTPIEFVFHNNQSFFPSTGEFSYCLIYEDAQLYQTNIDPQPTWTDADFSPLVVVAGGMARVNFEAPTPNPYQTLVIRAKLQGAPLWVQSLSFGEVEGY